MRFLRPSLFVFGIALLASLCIHLPVYEVLGALADELLHAAPSEAKSTVVELELAPLGEDETKQPEAPPEPVVLRDKVPEAAPPPQVREPEPEASPVAEPNPVVVEEIPAPAQPQPPIPIDNPLAVTQKSEDPTVEAPENPRFVAEENRRVLEETVARVRNMHRDDEQPSPSTAQAADRASEEPGDAPETEIADLQEVEGSDERPPDATEAAEKPVEPSKESAGEREAQAINHAPPEPAPEPPRPERAPARASGAEQTGGEQTLLVHDGTGTFVIRKAPKGAGEGEVGSDQKRGDPSREREDRKGSRKSPGVDLRLSWSQFEDTFGSDELQAERQAYLAQRKSRAAGSNTQRSWKKFRAAIENFVPNVAPGTQTALNTAASPFAAYLAEVHRRIHQEFAHDFLRNLPIAGGPYADRTLYTLLEIVINGDGSVHEIGVAQTSGFLPFDYGAFNSVMQAAPYPVPPRKILSGDGRVYVQWGFYRNERQCGTFNARPFILPNPRGTPKPAPGPLHDDGEEPAQPGSGPMPGEGEVGSRERSSPRPARS